MKNRKKALRRHHDNRKKRAWKAYCCRNGIPPTQRTIGMYASTAKPCSCYGCGNQRKYEGRTRQELIAAQYM